MPAIANAATLEFRGVPVSSTTVIRSELGLLSQDSPDLERVIAVWYTGRQSGRGGHREHREA